MAASAIAGATGREWIELFNGHSLEGWRPSENKGSWTVQNGALSANGPRSHLFYDGPTHGTDFRNFDLETEVFTRAECNSGVYFHTRYQESGFPEKGFEIQVNNTAQGDGTYRERKKTASLYGVRNVYKQFVPDGEWFTLRVLVRGKSVQVFLNGMKTVDYAEPTPPVIPAGGERERFLDHGTFALQCHNDGSKAMYRSVRVRPLPDNAAAPDSAPPVVDAIYRDVINIGRHNVPMVDYRVNLRNGLTLERALEKSWRDGIEYGLTFNGGTRGALKDDAGAREWLDRMRNHPVFLAFYAEGPEWTKVYSRKTIASFDYILGDVMSWTDDHGRAFRLSDPSSVGQIGDSEAFMDQLVERTVGFLEQQPVDIFSNPTYLPAPIAKNYDALWTEDRMRKVIEAAAKNQVAIEINNRRRLPSRKFVEMAKTEGCKFSFGTDNEGIDDLQRCEYGFEIYKGCKLEWQDFFTPGSWEPRAVERKSHLFQAD